MYLGLDLGTSGLRGLLIDEDGNAIASAEAGYIVNHPHPSWSEQDPTHWTTACESVIKKIRNENDNVFSSLKGIGVSGHMHGATLVDKNGGVLRPCMLWNDTRAHLEAGKLDALEGFREISGNIVFPGFTAPKVLWLAKNEPEIFEKIAKILLPKDYMNFWLTGTYSSDMSDAAGTAWLDCGKREWSHDLLSKSGMKQDQVPDLFEGSEPIGTLRSELAKKWGVGRNIIVVAGSGDNAAAACGVGALREGDAFVSLGTSGVLLAAKNSFAPMPSSAVHTFCHALPDRWYQMGVILAATDSLNWLSQLLDTDAENLSSVVGKTINGPNKMKFLPYLSGERTPHNDSVIRGAILNIDITSTRGDMVQTIMEGVSFALRDSLEALNSTGTELSQILGIGGGTQSPFWVEQLATVLNLQIDLPEKGEFGAALGAARLALVGTTGQDPEAIMTAPKVAKSILPRDEFIEEYQEAYERYRKSYPALRALT